MLRPTMNPLDELIHLIEQVSGVVVPDRDRGSLERLALEQSGRHGHLELRRYVARLRESRDAPEWQALLTRITVKESFLFRGPQQLRALADQVLPRMLAGRPADRPFRVWSAGCARGEEPTSLAMVLADSPELEGRAWSILATDVDESALRDARRAEFGPRAVASVPPPLLERYMVPRGGGRFVLADRLRARVAHRTLNLVGHWPVLPEAPFDLVFLRNVLIYFRPEQQRRVVEAVVEVLDPGGHLFLGPAESLWHLETGLVTMDLGDCFCFRRPTTPGPVRRQAVAASTPRIEHLVPGDDPQEGRVGEARPEVACPTTVQATAREIAEALELGAVVDAEALIREAVRTSPDNALLRAFQGLAAEASGDLGAAVASYRAALYLDPRLIQVRYLLARCLERAGQREQARRAFRDVLGSAGHGTVPVAISEAGRVGIPSTLEVISRSRQALEAGPSSRHRE